MSDPIGGVNGTSTTHPLNEAPVSVENPSANLDRDAFLKLLVAQLKFQDPSKPADTSQMLAQSAQLTMVDRMNEMADAMKSQITSQNMATASSLVGRSISFVDETGAIQTATVSSAKMENNGITVVAGGFSVPYAAIKSIHATPVGAPAPTPTPAPATEPAASDATDATTETATTGTDSASDETSTSSTDSGTETAAA